LHLRVDLFGKYIRKGRFSILFFMSILFCILLSLYFSNFEITLNLNLKEFKSMTFPTDNPAFRQAALPQPSIKKPQNQATTPTNTGSGQTQAAQVLNAGVAKPALPEFFTGFHPDLAQQFMIGGNILEPLCWPVPSQDSFDIEAMINLATKMAGEDGQLLKEEVQTFLDSNQLSPEQRNMANFLNNNFETIQQKLTAMIYVPPGVALIMAPGFRPEDLRKIAALDGNSKIISVADIKAPVPPPDESYSTDNVMAVARKLAGDDGQLSKDELEKFSQTNDLFSQDARIVSFLTKNFDAIRQKLQELRPQPPAGSMAPIFFPMGLMVEEFPQLAKLDGNPSTFGTQDLKVKITPPVIPPIEPPVSKDTFDTNQIIEFALGVAGQEGVLTRNELEGMMWPAVMDPKVIQGQNMQRFLLDNFQAIQEKLIALNPLPPGVMVALPIGINPKDLAKLAGLDGNPKTFGIADLKAPITPPPGPGPSDQVPTNSVLTLINRAGGKDRALTRDELKKYLKSPNLSKSAIRVANFVLDNFQAILDKLTQMDREAGIVNVKARTSLTAKDIQRLVGNDKNKGNLSKADFTITIPPQPPTPTNNVPTNSVLTLIKRAGGRDGNLTQAELNKYLKTPNLSKTEIRVANFINNNFQAILDKLTQFDRDAGIVNVRARNEITAQDIQRLVGNDGNKGNLSLNDIKVTIPPPPPPPPTGQSALTESVATIVQIAGGKDGVMTLEEMNTYFINVKPSKETAQAMQFIQNNYQALLDKARALGLSTQSPQTLQIGLTLEAVNAIAKLDGNTREISVVDLNTAPPPPPPGSFSFPDWIVWPTLETLDTQDGQNGNIKKETIEAFLNTTAPNSEQYAFAKVLLENFTVLSTVTWSGSGAFLPDDPNWQPTQQHVNLNLDRFRSIMSKPGDTEAQARTFDNSDLVGVEQQVFPPPPSIGPGFGGGPGPVIMDDIPRPIPVQGLGGPSE
jgi:hypothetical protein